MPPPHEQDLATTPSTSLLPTPPAAARAALERARRVVDAHERRAAELQAGNRARDAALNRLRGGATTMERSEARRVVDAVVDHERRGATWIAFEYFPPRTDEGKAVLMNERMAAMKKHKPLYVDVTWGAGGTTSESTMELCVGAQRKHGLTANMHLTCTNMPREKLDAAIADAQKNGIKNILALRGDPPAGQVDFKPVETGFACALDLLRFLKAKTGDAFSLSCAGYPEGHPQRIRRVAEVGRELTARERSRVSADPASGELFVCTDEDFAAEIDYLKLKVEAGAGMVVTQMFFDVQVYFDFVRDCRAAGVTVPIVPGVMCITSVAGFNRMATFCKTRVPDDLAAAMKALEGKDADAVKEFGVKFGVNMCRALLDSGLSRGLHFYTLNLPEVCTQILEGLGLANGAAA